MDGSLAKPLGAASQRTIANHRRARSKEQGNADVEFDSVLSTTSGDAAACSTTAGDSYSASMVTADRYSAVTNCPLDRRKSGSDVAALVTTPKICQRMLEYNQDGAVARRASSPDARLASAGNKDEALLHSKMKLYRALASHTSTAVREQEPSLSPEMAPRVPSFIQDLMHPPAHVLPPTFFIRLPFGLGAADAEGHLTRWSFIFTIVNTMVGSTLMCIPWGIENAGLLTGLIVTIGFGIISCYTCTLIFDWGATHPIETNGVISQDFGDVCEAYFGYWCKQVANITSIVTLVGAAVCYHVLMATNLQAVALSVAHFLHGDINFILCCGEAGSPTEYAASSLLVALCIAPLLFVRDIGKLSRIGSYGVIALIYSVIFITSSAAFAIANSFSSVESNDQKPAHLGTVKMIGSAKDVGVFIGMMGLSLFVHSLLLPIVGSHAQLRTAPSVVKRDLGAAYALTVMLYVVVGVIPAVAFQLGRDILPQYRELGLQELPQNVLLAFSQSNWGALLGRAGFVFQIGIVYPIVVAVSRKQLFAGCFHLEDTGKVPTMLFNIIVITLTTAVGATFPNPGSVVGYIGTFTAVVYVLWLPLLVHLRASKRAGRNSKLLVFSNIFLGVGGTTIILMQFVV